MKQYFKKISLIMSLVFFFLLGCNDNAKEAHVLPIWENNRVTKLLIPLNGQKKVSVHVGSSDKDILGEFVEGEGFVVFTPVIPLTRGLNYSVMGDGKLIETIRIPVARDNAPEVYALYPTRDTVPENLLKVYIQFSQPMREGESLKHIELIRNGVDTIKDVFLDLEPELWDSTRRMLTLWLDPGRIKRDLQPNLKLGPPLRKGEKWRLIIKEDWQDQNGTAMKSSFEKYFVVGERDSNSPDINQWQLSNPKAGSIEALKINLNEPLDYALLKDAVQMEGVEGEFKIFEKESVLFFVPSAPWQKGDYTLSVEPRLEDNAGNNLDHLFDKDLTKPTSGKVTTKRTFTIK